MKIGIMSLYCSENLGEELYSETVKMICEKELSGASFEIIDIHGRDKKKKASFILKILSKLHFRSAEYHLRVKRENRFLKRYYREKIKDCAGVIVPGGGYIKSSKKDKWDSYHRYNDYFAIMADACQKRGIKLFFNAVGHVNTGNEETEINTWKKVFAHPAICFLTCRDEISFFQKAYGEGAKQVCCSAAYSGELFNISPDTSSNTIGIGIMRPENFALYGYDFSRDEYLVLIENLICSLEKRGHEVKLFTNGLTADYQIGLEIQKKMSREDLLIRRPTNCKDLVEDISKFKAVIVSRMHAAIAAYSLDIPTVCLCWNNKHKGFMESAGVGDLAIYPGNFNVQYIEEKLAKAIKNGWPEMEKANYRETALLSLRSICDILKRGGS